MKRSRFVRGLALFAIAVVFSAAVLGSMPHFHPEVGGREQEQCTPCFLHQAVQPLIEQGNSLILQTFLEQPFIPAVELPVLSQRTIGWSLSRAPPQLSPVLS